MKEITGAIALELLGIGKLIWVDDQIYFREYRDEMIAELHRETACADVVIRVFPKSDLQELLLNGLKVFIQE